MAYAFTVVRSSIQGGRKKVVGTFTTATGDNSGSLANGTHGLNYVETYRVEFTPAGLNTPVPKVANSTGTLTITTDDTEGYSGNWEVIGL